MSSFNPSMILYIPHVAMTISTGRIIRLFESLDIGKVSSVVFTNKFDRNGKKYKTAVVHFERWFYNQTSRNLQIRIRESTYERPYRMVYDDPLFWILLEYGVKLLKASPPDAYAVNLPKRQTCKDSYTSQPRQQYTAIVEENPEFIAWAKREQAADNERFDNQWYIGANGLPDYTDQQQPQIAPLLRQTCRDSYTTLEPKKAAAVVEENPGFLAWANREQAADNERFGRQGDVDPQVVIENLQNQHAVEIFALQQENERLRDMLNQMEIQRELEEIDLMLQEQADISAEQDNN